MLSEYRNSESISGVSLKKIIGLLLLHVHSVVICASVLRLLKKLWDCTCYIFSRNSFSFSHKPRVCFFATQGKEQKEPYSEQFKNAY
jgi:hypothetical protein